MLPKEFSRSIGCNIVQNRLGLRRHFYLPNFIVRGLAYLKAPFMTLLYLLSMQCTMAEKKICVNVHKKMPETLYSPFGALLYKASSLLL